MINELAKKVEATLVAKFWNDFQMDFKDEKGDGKHFFLSIVSREFDDLSRIERSQLVYELLDEYMKTWSIHALRMNLKAPSEI
jgi:acid stress-induced BolA-like protein IbaG/YrbA